MKRLAILVFATCACVHACARDVAGNSPPRTYDTSCQADTDCVAAPACCPTPCTEDVINVRDVQRARDQLRCDGARPCPSAGGCVTFAYLCVRSACKLVFANDPDYRPRR